MQQKLAARSYDAAITGGGKAAMRTCDHSCEIAEAFGNGKGAVGRAVVQDE